MTITELFRRTNGKLIERAKASEIMYGVFDVKMYDLNEAIKVLDELDADYDDFIEYVNNYAIIKIDILHTLASFILEHAKDYIYYHSGVNIYDDELYCDICPIISINKCYDLHKPYENVSKGLILLVRDIKEEYGLDKITEYFLKTISGGFNV